MREMKLFLYKSNFTLLFLFSIFSFNLPKNFGLAQLPSKPMILGHIDIIY